MGQSAPDLDLIPARAVLVRKQDRSPIEVEPRAFRVVARRLRHAAARIVGGEDTEQYIVCPRCQDRSAVDADLCGRCRLPFTTTGVELVGSPTAEVPALLCLLLGLGAMAVHLCSVPLAGAGAALGAGRGNPCLGGAVFQFLFNFR